MKIFISWSGAQSGQIARVIKEWLPTVLNECETFLSLSDIDAGARWNEQVGKQLSETNYGLVCLTQSNLRAPWLLFESGALGKSLEGRVATLLFNVELSAVDFPLKQFQATRYDKEEFRTLVLAMNDRLKNPQTHAHVEKMFERAWEPDFQKPIDLILQTPEVSPPPKSESPEDRILNLIAELQNQQVALMERFGRLESSLERIGEIYGSKGGDLVRVLRNPARRTEEVEELAQRRVAELLRDRAVHPDNRGTDGQDPINRPIEPSQAGDGSPQPVPKDETVAK